MDSDKVKKICAGYREALSDWAGVDNRAARMPEDASDALCDDLPDGYRVAHFLFMTEEIPRLLDAGRTEKAMRWLGWLQGALWGLNFESLHDAKLRNAPEGAEYSRDA